MTETLVVAEPGGWLAEYQRAHCAGDSALSTYQGLLADEIVLPQSAAENSDPAIMVLACNAWAEAMQNQVLLIAGEYAPEATWGYYVHDYLTQAMASGHAQYFAARGGDELALKCAGAGLKSMIADPHLDLFNLMVRLRRLPRPAAQKLAKQKGYGSIALAFRGLDKKLHELEAREPLAPRHKTWLKSLRKLKIAPDAEMSSHLVRIAQLNPLRARRLEEAARVRAEHERTDPAFKAVRTLCEMAGAQFNGLGKGAFAEMHSVWPEGPQRPAYVVRADTDRGALSAAFYVEGGFFKRQLAVLIEPGRALPLGSLKLSKSDYEAIVPGGGR
jgi:hypothetical protein